MLLQSVLPSLLIGAASEGFIYDSFNKIGFDLDVIGRQRNITQLIETIRLMYDKAGTQVNIAVWNMHVLVENDFKDIITTGLDPMGKGGGFRIVVFSGDGYMRNHGALGLDNWRCSGNFSQDGRLATFKKIGKQSSHDAKIYDWEMPEWMPRWMQWVL